MEDDTLTVQDWEGLPKDLTQMRECGKPYGEWSKPEKIGDTIVHPESVGEKEVTIKVEKIRYTNGFIYCMGKDISLYVDVRNESWMLVPHPESFPLRIKRSLPN